MLCFLDTDRIVVVIQLILHGEILICGWQWGPVGAPRTILLRTSPPRPCVGPVVDRLDGRQRRLLRRRPRFRSPKGKSAKAQAAAKAEAAAAGRATTSRPSSCPRLSLSFAGRLFNDYHPVDDPVRRGADSCGSECFMPARDALESS